MQTDATCPRCGAPRFARADCPKCGVIYAKAEARLAPVEEASFLTPIDEAAAWDGGREGALELKIRLFAVPAALLFAWGLVNAGFLRSLTRTVLTMWIHELGHAAAGWLSGFAAIPLPWVTRIPEERSTLFSLLFAGLVVAWLVRSWRRQSRVGLAVGAVLLVAQVIGTFGLKVETARALITFGGDGGLFILGSFLMATMFVPPGHHLQKSWLRWGFLVIGACAFADGFKVWWDASRDFAAIPFGENEGVGLSDASKLVDVYGWEVRDLIRRYLVLAGLCFAALVAVNVRGVLEARHPERWPRASPDE